MNLEGKRLLILGGTSASLDLVKQAKSMGVHTIVTDEKEPEERVSKRAADEYAMVSTTDIEELCSLIREKNIDGAFCGPSEFNLRNLIALCERSGLPCYTTKAVWDNCANKDTFKRYCRRFGVDTPEEYDIHLDMTDEELSAINYPIIIKPVDGSSSIGISVCQKKEEVMDAYFKAIGASKCKRIVAEEYVENGGRLFGARYLVQDGEAYPYLLIDTYVVDPVNRKSLISAYTQTPSSLSSYYMENMDKQVREMIRGMDIRNGTVFFQALPYKGKILFHEMGYRLSGGMIYKLTEPLLGINDMKMMLRFALGGECITKEELEKIESISLCGNDKFGAQLMVPLSAGIVGKIEGLKETLELPEVTDFIQYYDLLGEVKPEFIGTLQQHFGRYTLISDSEEKLHDAVDTIQNVLKITSTEGEIMNNMKFSLSRLSD